MPVTKAMEEQLRQLVIAFAAFKEKMECVVNSVKEEIKATYDEIKDGYEEMIAEMKAGREEMKVGREKVREQLQQMKVELAEETGAIKEDAEITEVASETSEDEEMRRVSAPALQENSTTLQSICMSHSADCSDINLILNQDTSGCKELGSIHDCDAEFGAGSHETEANKHVATAKITKVNYTHDVNKLQGGEQTVSDLPVDEKPERTESWDCDMKNRRTSENCSEKVLDLGIT
ncbi:hypothetical protein X975_03485, partial [Stegodyphus mimosarum]